MIDWKKGNELIGRICYVCFFISIFIDKIDIKLTIGLGIASLYSLLVSK